jgi:uncharacterized protein YbcV (DUF1398 family)
METQLIIQEIFDNTLEELNKSKLLNATMHELITKYEAMLSQNFVRSCKCSSIAKILDKNSNEIQDEKYLLEQLNISKRIYTKTMKQ